MQTERETRRGIIFALSAYTVWGFSPIYFKMLAAVSPIVIVCHRVVWSVFFLAFLLFYKKQWKNSLLILRQKRTCMILICTSLLIIINWLVFIWAVNNDHILDASLGYYINPLVNVLLGMLFLREKLSLLQWFAVALAVTGVAVQLIHFGSLPWVALVLAFSFGFYGLLRKKIIINPGIGLFIETTLLFPIALLYLWITYAENPGTETNPLTLNLLLVGSGLVTTIPLLFFTAAAARLHLSTLGFFQYIAPSLMFFLAFAVYGEPFTLNKGITFAFIWTGLGVFTLDLFRKSKRVRQM